MVEYNVGKAQVPIVLDDVRKIVTDQYGFVKGNEEFLFSTPAYLSKEEYLKKFREFFSEESEWDEGTAFVSFRDGNLYLNHERLNNEENEHLFENWLFAILAWGHPYAFVIKETGYGKQLPRKVNKPEDLGSNLLNGISRAVEIDALKESGKYYSKEVEGKLIKYLNTIGELEDKNQKVEIQEGYKIIRDIQEKVEKSEDIMDEITKARIVKAVLKVTGRDKNFDENLRKLASWRIHEIYREAGAKILEPSQKVGEVEEIVRNVFEIIGSHGQARDVVSGIERALNKYYNQIGGSPDIYNQGEKILEELQAYPDYEPGSELPHLYEGRIVEMLKNLENSLKGIKGRKRQIEFR